MFGGMSAPAPVYAAPAPAPAPPAYTAYTQPPQYSGPPAYAEDDDASGPPPAPVEEYGRDFTEAAAAATINANSASIAGMFA